MPILHVRNIPPELYARIQEQAAEDNRSFSAQVIVLLQAAVQGVHRRRAQAALLADIRRRRPRLAAGTPDSADLLREDRER